MHISELIAKLQEAMAEHGDLRVVIDGYEGGYDDASFDGLIHLCRDVGREENWWYGKHELPCEGYDRPAEEHVLIGGRGSRGTLDALAKTPTSGAADGD